MIWKLPDSKLTDRLMAPTEPGYSSHAKVALSNDYIACSTHDSIAVWKTSLDNLEHQLQVYFKFRFGFGDICVHNGIIYTKDATWNYESVISSWNIKTGRINIIE